MTRSRFLFLLCTISFVTRLAVGILQPVDDVGRYEQFTIAQNMVNGHGFAMNWPYEPADSTRASLWHAHPVNYPGAFMPPLVPAVDAFFLAITPSVDVAVKCVVLLQCLVGALIPLLVFWAAMVLFDHERTARWSAALSLLYLPGLVASATPAGSVFYVAAALAVCTLSALAWRRGTHLWQLGLLCGLLTLMRSEFLVLGLVFCVGAIVRGRWKGGMALAVFMLVLAPWTIRNAIVLHRFVPVITHPYREVWRGNNPLSTGSGYAADGRDIWEDERYPDIVRELDAVPVSASYEVDADAIFKRNVLQAWSSDPLRYLLLACKKVAMLWSVDIYYPKARNPLYVLPTLLLLAAFFTSLRFLARAPWLAHIFILVAPFVVFWVYYSALFGVTYVLPRYQIFVLATIMPFIGGVVTKFRRDIDRPSSAR